MTGLTTSHSEPIRTAEDGFTLIELMLVLGIVGILASLAITNYLRQLPAIRAKSAARQIWLDFKRAQSAALSKNTDVVVIFYPVKDTYDILIDTNSDFGDTGAPVLSGPNADQYLFKDRSLPETISFASGLGTVAGVDVEGLDDGVTLPDNRVFFQPSGRASSDNEDTFATLLTKTKRSVYIIPESDISKNNSERLWAVTINGISGNAEMLKYHNGKWGE